jgi:glycosyltransferase involved in cell wall biosynthesis
VTVSLLHPWFHARAGQAAADGPTAVTDKSMTVGVDVSPLGSVHTGIARYTYELVAALQLAWPEGRVTAIGNRSGVPLPPAPTGGWFPRRGPVFPSRSAWTFALLPLWLPGSGIDVFHATSYYAPIGARLPTVVTIHDLGMFVHPGLHPQARVLRARSILPVVARRAAAVIVPSRSVEAEAIAWLGLRPERVHVVPEAPADVFRRPVASAEVAAALARYGLDPGFFLAVGALEPRKNLGRVAEALDLLSRERGEGVPPLVVAGPTGWKFGSVEDSVRRAGVAERVRFLGFVPDPDLRALMGAARGLLYPSLYEGFGLPVVEAMAAGLPVVTSHSGALAELATGAALLADPLNVGSIAAAMRQLLDDEALRRCLPELGRARAAEYTWERTARQTLDVYRAAVERAGARR